MDIEERHPHLQVYGNPGLQHHFAGRVRLQGEGCRGIGPDIDPCLDDGEADLAVDVPHESDRPAHPIPDIAADPLVLRLEEGDHPFEHSLHRDQDSRPEYAELDRPAYPQLEPDPERHHWREASVGDPRDFNRCLGTQRAEVEAARPHDGHRADEGLECEGA